MEHPAQVVFRNLPHSDAVEAAVRERVAKLEHFHPSLLGCRVTIEEPHRHHHQGKLYRVTVELSVPGENLSVTRDPSEHHAHEDVYVTIRDAFDAARRRLEDRARRERGEVKTHAERPRGRVARVLREQGYGFLETPDGREIYFHRNAVAGGAFDGLSEGAEVFFSEEMGEKGPQATAVHLSGR